jgi:hypothetical protein
MSIPWLLLPVKYSVVAIKRKKFLFGLVDRFSLLQRALPSMKVQSAQ